MVSSPDLILAVRGEKKSREGGAVEMEETSADCPINFIVVLKFYLSKS